MPHPAPRPRHFKLILATVGLFTSLLIFIALFKGLRIYCANPRVRAERAARIEERRNKREYRRAACKYHFQQVLSRFRRRSRSQDATDYEEKRAMLRGRNSTSAIPPTTMDINIEDHIIGSNIESLRRAHEIVGQLMLAEEGRSQTHPQLQICPQFQPDRNTQYYNHGPNLPSSSRSVHSIRTTTTLPAYIPPPPRYSQELAREIHDVVDGFRYTPTQSGHTPSSSTSSPSTFMLDDESDNEHGNGVANVDNDTDVDVGTESSVADCISRMSFSTETEADAEVMRRKGSFSLAGDRYIGRFD